MGQMIGCSSPGEHRGCPAARSRWGLRGSGLSFHAVICCHGNHRSERIERTKAHVQSLIETIGLSFTGSVFVLNPVRQG